MTKKKTIIAVAIAVVLPFSYAFGTIPVIDYTAIMHMVLQGLRQIQQYTQQIQQYQLQLQQYKNQLLNSTGIGQAAQVWQNAQQTMGSVMSTVNMFRSSGGLQGYMNQFRDVNYWLSSSTGQYSNQSAGYWSTSQKRANEQMVTEIAQQEERIRRDAQTLERLQSSAGSTAGQKQSLDVANEIASLQGEQLLEIRTLLISEQQALAARNGTVATDESMRQANTQEFLNANQSVSQPHTGWSPVVP